MSQQSISSSRTKKGRLVVISKTEEKRILGVVLEAKGGGKFYRVTAYDADKNDSALYNRIRGGENDEKRRK